MAIYRTISMSFWTDSKVVDDFTPEDRYFYLYLFTNPHTNLCGCYEVSTKQMAYEVGYSIDSIIMLLKRFEEVHNVLRYSEGTKEVLLLNWHKYNWTSSEKFRKPLLKEITEVKDDSFRQYLQDLADGKEPRYGIDTNCTDITVTVTDTVTVSNTVTDTVSNNLNNINDIEIVDEEIIITDFDRFWEEYPKKVGKKEAKKAFGRAKKTTDAETMIRAVIAQKSSGQWKRDNGRYIPNPATWLNQGRWDDEIQVEKTMKEKQDEFWANL